MELKLDELKEGMEIQSYLGLDERFASLDQRVCDWLTHNFPGTQVGVRRQSQTLDLAIAELRPGDQVIRVFGFPNALQHLTTVNPKLIGELGRQGFKRFSVNTVTGVQSKSRESKVAEVNQLVEKAKAGAVVREHAAVAIESLMDGLAQGVSDLKSLEPLVNSIIENTYMDAMAALATLKESDHTYGHCVDVGAIFTGIYQKICDKKGIPSAFKDAQETLLAALLHDVGKAKVPKEILESSVTFEKNSSEMRLMRSHPEKSGELLKEMGLPEVVVNMGMYHHLKLDGQNYSSYPKGASIEQASYETRLLAIIDTYQALIGRRPYKKSWTAPAAMRYIDALAGIEFDEDVFEDVISVLGLYPLGSLVELSTGQQGFVMNIPEEDVERPLIAVIIDAKGGRITPAEMVDLEKDTEIKITKELDPVEVLGDTALDEFTSLKVN